MPLIQGFATHAAGAELLPYKYDPGDIKPNEVEIAISHCGICRSDLHLIDNDWGISQYPLIPGHEIIGTVTATGTAVLGLNLGERVGGLAGKPTAAGTASGVCRARKIYAPISRAPAFTAMAGMPTGCASTPASYFLFPKGWRASGPRLCFAVGSRSTTRFAALASILHRGWGLWGLAAWGTWRCSLPELSGPRLRRSPPPRQRSRMPGRWGQTTS
jgi:hypothetical protein